MKAIILKGFAGVENLVEAEVPVPYIASNEVLVKVRALAINPVDIKTRRGSGLAPILKDIEPIILGWDISGTIIETGGINSPFKTGDEVFGMINFPGHGKAYSEYVAAPAEHLALKPEGVSHEQAAAASLAALTAWQLLKYKIKLTPGSRILIHAAAGGVGHYAVQMARYLGAWVAGTASSKNREFVLSLGADMFIDYETGRFEDIMKDMDFVLDSIGGEYSERSFNVLKPGGTIICIPSGTSPHLVEKARAKGLIGDHFRVASGGDHMKEIADLLRKGHIKSFLSGIYPFNEIRTVHEQIETGKTKGKIVVRTE